jgi:hypothetical protein
MSFSCVYMFIPTDEEAHMGVDFGQRLGLHNFCPKIVVDKIKTLMDEPKQPPSSQGRKGDNNNDD